MIERFPDKGLGRCEAVVLDDIIYAVATDPGSTEGVVAQTRAALSESDRILAAAGSGKAGLLQVTVYLADVRDKAKIDPAWIEWIGLEENWPQRACVGVGLDEGCLI